VFDPKGLVGQEVAGFKLVEVLGEGGMAVVYRGENVLSPSIQRAIKVIRPELSGRDEFAKRFAREAQMLEDLRHENVVRFFGLRREKAGDSMVMLMELELLDGDPLSAVARRSTTPPGLLQAVEWIRQAAEGVAAAHAQKLVHRDLKPENIVLTKSGKVKVLDFGVAKALDDADRESKLTVTGTVPGSPPYMSPEVCKGAIPGTSADVYALGVSLLEVLFGYHPFAPPGEDFKSSTQLMFMHVNDELPKVRSVRRDAPPQLEAVIDRATAKDPKERYPDAKTLAAALKEVSGYLPGGEGDVRADISTQFAVPTLSNEMSTPQTMVREAPPVEKSRTLLFAAAAVAVLGLGAGGAWWFGASRDEEPITVPNDHDEVVEAEPDAGTAATSDEANPWVRVEPPSEAVLLGASAQSDDSERGFRPGRAVMSPGVPYEIQRHEVTWSELDPWLEANATHAFERPSTVPGDPDERALLPATGVPWATAQAYCRAHDGSLPTEEQFEFAARGSERRPYPWGDQRLDLTRTRVYAATPGAVVPVMSADQDRTPGADFISDLVGNAQEWTVDLYREDFPDQDESWVQEGGMSFRAIRGLPLASSRPPRLPAIGAAHRDALCATGECPAGAAVLLQSIGFRCVRNAR
jgi:serine/threonine-protein kinase